MKKRRVSFHTALCYLWLSSGVMLSLTEEALANCGSPFACNTFNGTSWTTVGGAQAVTYLSNARFTFANSSTYPMVSDNKVERTSSSKIHLTVTTRDTVAAASKYFFEPSNQLTWNAAKNGYNIRGYTQDLVLRFEMRIFKDPNYTQLTGQSAIPVPIGQHTMTNLPRKGLRRSGDIDFTMRVTAVLTAPQTQSIYIPTTTLFTMYGPGGDGHSRGPVMGRIDIQGAPAIQIDPPKPKTCDAIPAGTERVFPLRAIPVNSLSAGQTSSEAETQDVTLTNCPAGVKIRMTVSDAAFPNNNADYLRNQQGTGYAANAGIRLYYNDNRGYFGEELITMNTWRKEITTTAGTMQLPFTAKYYHTGGNLGIGLVRATATLSITYP